MIDPIGANLQGNKSEDPEIYYLAGYFDGEGCISYPKNGDGTYKLTTVIASADPEVLSIFHRRYGGYFREEPKWKGSRALMYRWIAANKRAYNCLVEIGPYFKVKREQAYIVLDSSGWKWNNPGNIAKIDLFNERMRVRRALQAAKRKKWKTEARYATA